LKLRQLKSGKPIKITQKLVGNYLEGKKGTGLPNSEIEERKI